MEDNKKLEIASKRKKALFCERLGQVCNQEHTSEGTQERAPPFP